VPREVRLGVELLPAGDRPFSAERALQIEALHPVIAGVRDVEHLRRRVDRQTDGLDELTGSVPSPPTTRYACRSHRTRGSACSRCRRRRRCRSERSRSPWAPERGLLLVPVEQEAAVVVELDDPMVPGVGHVDRSVAADGDTAGWRNLPGPSPASGPPQTAIDDPLASSFWIRLFALSATSKVACAIDRDAARRGELAGARTGATDRPPGGMNRRARVLVHGWRRSQAYRRERRAAERFLVTNITRRWCRSDSRPADGSRIGRDCLPSSGPTRSATAADMRTGAPCSSPRGPCSGDSRPRDRRSVPPRWSRSAASLSRRCSRGGTS